MFICKRRKEAKQDGGYLQELPGGYTCEGENDLTSMQSAFYDTSNLHEQALTGVASCKRCTTIRRLRTLTYLTGRVTTTPTEVGQKREPERPRG